MYTVAAYSVTPLYCYIALEQIGCNPVNQSDVLTGEVSERSERTGGQCLEVLDGRVSSSL